MYFFYFSIFIFYYLCISTNTYTLLNKWANTGTLLKIKNKKVWKYQSGKLYLHLFFCTYGALFQATEAPVRSFWTSVFFLCDNNELTTERRTWQRWSPLLQPHRSRSQWGPTRWTEDRVKSRLGSSNCSALCLHDGESPFTSQLFMKPLTNDYQCKRHYRSTNIEETDGV